jgi:hypothetical protein
MNQQSELANRPLEAKDCWPHFVRAGALNAWVIVSGGDVERARTQGILAAKLSNS